MSRPCRIAAPGCSPPSGRTPPQVEAGLWRARMEDVLRERPELVLVLSDLAEEARRRVEGLYPIG